MGSHLSLNAVHIAVQLVLSCMLDSRVEIIANSLLFSFGTAAMKILPHRFCYSLQPRVQLALLKRIQHLSDRDIQIEGRDRFAALIDVAESLAHQSDAFAPIQLDVVAGSQESADEESACGSSEGAIACYNDS